MTWIIQGWFIPWIIFPKLILFFTLIQSIPRIGFSNVSMKVTSFLARICMNNAVFQYIPFGMSNAVNHSLGIYGLWMHALIASIALFMPVSTSVEQKLIVNRSIKSFILLICSFCSVNRSSYKSIHIQPENQEIVCPIKKEVNQGSRVTSRNTPRL